MRVCVCLSLSLLTKYLKKYLINQLCFGGDLPSGPGMKSFDFEKNHSGVRADVRGKKFWPNDKEQKMLAIT